MSTGRCVKNPPNKEYVLYTYVHTCIHTQTAQMKTKNTHHVDIFADETRSVEGSMVIDVDSNPYESSPLRSKLLVFEPRVWF